MVTAAALSEIETDLANSGLIDAGHVPLSDGALMLLSPSPEFWPIFQCSKEWKTQAPDPVDDWSLRVISGLADRHQAEPLFPFEGPSYHPFLVWASASGEAWTSPTGPLVHHRLGMMISYRGALKFHTDLPQRQAQNPCETCTDKPCLSACPVSALHQNHSYDVPRCYEHLKSPEGQAGCYAQGCAVRCACPASRGANRHPSQSAYHMTRFLP